MAREPTFNEVLTAAVADLQEHGFTDAERLEYWTLKLKEAAERSMGSQAQMEQILREGLTSVYRRLVENGGIAKYHGGIERFTIERLNSQMRLELDKRILASSQLIKLDREKRIAETLSRFSGWATSIPAGGSDIVNRTEEKAHVKKALGSLDFVHRRLLTDQSLKLASSINAVIALNGDAIAAAWQSHKFQRDYDSRPKHAARQGKVFAIRGNWALAAGLMKAGPNGYTDEIEQPAEFVSCKCWYAYKYNLRDLPDDMLTAKGRAWLAEARAKVAAL